MQNQFKSFSTNYCSEKAVSLAMLSAKGIPMPFTALINKNDIALLDKYVECVVSWKKQHLYLRCSFSNITYPHYYSDFTSPNELKDKALSLIKKADTENIEDYDLICQPLIGELEWTGGLIKFKNGIYLEIVKGASLMLFRRGEYYRGYFKDDSTTFVRNGEQTKVITIKDGIPHATECHVEDNVDISYLASILRYEVLPDGFLYEFGFDGETPYYFEGKKLPNDSYCCVKNYNGNRPFCLKQNTIIDSECNAENDLYFSDTDFNNISDLNKYSGRRIFILSGSILSHFVFWILQNGFCLSQPNIKTLHSNNPQLIY